MSFLTLNGIVVPVAVESAKEDPPEEIGESSRAHGGSMRKSIITTKAGWSAETTPITTSEARALRRLLLGEGHRWSFDSNLYSSKGLGPNVGYAAAQSTSGGGKYGAGYLSVNATTGTITWAYATGSEWTVFVWRFESAAWHHYAVRSDGSAWKDAVADSVPTWLTVSGSVVTIANTTGAAVKYDDLVVLPYQAPSSWVSSIYNAGSAFSDLWKLSAAGDFIERAPVSVLGSPSDARVVKTASGLRTVLSFQLREA